MVRPEHLLSRFHPQLHGDLPATWRNLVERWFAALLETVATASSPS